MNEHITVASALLFIRSLRKAFFGGWKGAAMAIPAVGLSKLYVDAAVDYIRRRGGEVRCSTDVVGVIVTNGSVAGVRFRDGSVQEGSACLLTVPSNKLRGVLPEGLPGVDSLGMIMDMPVSPIVSIHLWFGREFMEHDVVGLVGRRIQWVFNKRRIDLSPDTGPHVSAVISAAHNFVLLDNERLATIALEDLKSVYGARVSEPLHVVVIREKRATFSATPAAERARPATRTSIPNLFLCGDWTDTGYPATIEGAVLSGERGAEAVRAASVAFQKSIDHITDNKERPL
jgi:monoamine oxidase